MWAVALYSCLNSYSHQVHSTLMNGTQSSSPNEPPFLPLSSILLQKCDKQLIHHLYIWKLQSFYDSLWGRSYKPGMNYNNLYHISQFISSYEILVKTFIIFHYCFWGNNIYWDYVVVMPEIQQWINDFIPGRNSFIHSSILFFSPSFFLFSFW